MVGEFQQAESSMTSTKAQAQELTALEAARMAGIRLDVIYPLLRAGRIQGQKVDGEWRVSAASLEAHIAKRQQRNRK
jgi:hypothetical protein